ncbi:hypothetical protein ACUY19_01665 [Corynebacterium kroppenstedtii]
MATSDVPEALQDCRSHRDLLKPSYYWMEYMLHSVAVNDLWSRRAECKVV